MQTPALTDLDSKYLVHPVSNFRDHQEKGVKILTSGNGAWLTAADGNTYLDAFAGLWCVNIGYGQQRVVDAAIKQMTTLPYATGYFGFGSEPAIVLAEKLVSMTPASLQHVYFSLGGSDAVDAAIRYITHYFNAIGKPAKKHIISLQRGYHGSSSTGAGITGLPAFHANFDVPTPQQHKISCPYLYRSEFATGEELIAASVKELEDKVAEIGADNVAAFFCEPVVGSGGVVVPPKGWLKAIADTCKRLGILFLVDEVITGFGRTGKMFACEHEGVEPDLMTIAKGLTSGYAPMGAVLMSDEIFNGIADGPNKAAVVGHGQTYSAHPVSAAVALEVIKIYEESMLAHAQSVAPYFEAKLQACMAHPLVGDARSIGLLGAIELVADKATKRQFDPALKLNETIADIAWKHKLIFRAFGDNILGFAPALCFTESDFDALFERLQLTLDEVLQLNIVKQEMKG
ncbi:aminotransferase class III-fold pyridoxal phosphate-dependent enzyme [uncultured Alteromonas sp.]|jgi:adenosylmethionine-8-amino-7-oxononanoate aminotransferase|uniref:aminotransferase class III-fold pyridoxal phosphate-dependent enzyme n=1 Tax=uncultured Alteromonas sp. TaxID=179113 RepID=UPI0025DB83A4|nr:aminotransferase class III-fold pyridoxal phosphate-dependent enzyme [uncultured Alteromonas sp.]